uniref:uncharacterized protein LOC105351714 n=1 Tax=Fragaria vesca subsp. vesca TaxID=101020 RepID=UPI0005CB64B5|nr:PREDICTED: uncharacterized protein LOC105351714 [Fragaria vesca subsp. vesca]
MVLYVFWDMPTYCKSKTLFSLSKISNLTRNWPLLSCQAILAALAVRNSGCKNGRNMGLVQNHCLEVNTNTFMQLSISERECTCSRYSAMQVSIQTGHSTTSQHFPVPYKRPPYIFQGSHVTKTNQATNSSTRLYFAEAQPEPKSQTALASQDRILDNALKDLSSLPLKKISA